MPQSNESRSTAEQAYADRLIGLQNKSWKRLLNVQAPWKRHFRSLRLGRTIDVGCGIGRLLRWLEPGSVGVDHNPYSIAALRGVGLEGYTVEEFFASEQLTTPGGFDSLLAAHVIEHLEPAEARTILASYLPFVKPGGRVVWVTPQERGYASDATHITFTDFDAMRALAADLGLQVERQYSFPFPRFLGKAFTYNEFFTICRTPAA